MVIVVLILLGLVSLHDTQITCSDNMQNPLTSRSRSVVSSRYMNDGLVSRLAEPLVDAIQVWLLIQIENTFVDRLSNNRRAELRGFDKPSIHQHHECSGIRLSIHPENTSTTRCRCRWTAQKDRHCTVVRHP